MTGMILSLLLALAQQSPSSPGGLLHPNKSLPAHLDTEQIERAEFALAAADAVGATSTAPESAACNFAQMPLDVAFSDYTVQANGTVLQDGGWTPAQRDYLSAFLCKMMPIIDAQYGPPWQRYTLTIVKDLRYTNTNVFIPLTGSIHTAMDAPPINAQLLTHELLHAWRYQRTLTMNLGAGSLYSPVLSGFEEGFAQGISYACLNQYVTTYGQGDPHAGYFRWGSDNDWDYDFRNDSSMSAWSFFSESAGTLKYFDRYEQGAAVFLMLLAADPVYAPQFNAAWYAYADAAVASNPAYMPTRAEVAALLASVLPALESGPPSAWLDRQRILDCQPVFGKELWWWKDWIPSPIAHSYYRIHYIETFPDGGQWAYYVQSHGAYLIHRLNGHSGSFVAKDWTGQIVAADRCRMKDPKWWQGIPPVCGLTCAVGFGMEEVHWYEGVQPSPAGYQTNSPILLPIEPTGLYAMKVVHRNPHYVAPPSQPLYGLAYDATQQFADEIKYQLVMTSSEGVGAFVAGGVVGINEGSVLIEHSGASQTVPLVNGLFLAPQVPAWVETHLGGALQTAKPGLWRFTITPTAGAPLVVEKLRDWGAATFASGRCYFLLEPALQ